MDILEKLLSCVFMFVSGCLFVTYLVDIVATYRFQRQLKLRRTQGIIDDLRELVREAYAEGFSDCPVYGDVDEDRAWSKSSAKDRLDELESEIKLSVILDSSRNK